MLFITNRDPKGSIKATAKAKPFQFDLDKNAPANSVFYCERKGERKYSEIGSASFMKRLKDSPSK
jgi:hypothetical protein